MIRSRGRFPWYSKSCRARPCRRCRKTSSSPESSSSWPTSCSSSPCETQLTSRTDNKPECSVTARAHSVSAAAGWWSSWVGRQPCRSQFCFRRLPGLNRMPRHARDSPAILPPTFSTFSTCALIPLCLHKMIEISAGGWLPVASLEPKLKLRPFTWP